MNSYMNVDEQVIKFHKSQNQLEAAFHPPKAEATHIMSEVLVVVGGEGLAWSGKRC